MDKQAALQNYIDGMGVSQNPQFIKFVKDFLNFATDLDRDNIVRYTQHLRDQDFSSSTIELWQRTLRALYRRNDVKWPLKRGENARIDPEEEEVYMLGSDRIQAMVEAAKSHKLPIVDAWLLALSTTYGLRLVELSRVTSQRVDLTHRHIYVETAKGGEQRYHYLPDELMDLAERVLPYLSLVTYRYVSEAFPRIESMSGLTHKNGVGWHALRHSLLYYLIESGVTEMAATEFMRWSTPGNRSSMPKRYHKGQILGLDTEAGADIGRYRVQDMALFEKHPFLPYWRG